MLMSSNEDECRDAALNPLTRRVTQKKTQELYKAAYTNFVNWKASKNYQLCTENTFIEYFTELMSKTLKPPTLWCTFSMLRSTVKLNEGVDIKFYPKLFELLKRHSVGYKSKKCKVLSISDIKRFLKQAPDDIYLVMKVALIFGVDGSCTIREMCRISIKDVEEHDDILLVKVKNENNKIPRSFTIHGKHYQIVKKYMDLRSKKEICERFFQNFQKGKCTSQPIGHNKLSAMPKKIARFLGLPNPDEYTGHSFKQTSKILQVDKETPNITSNIDDSQSNTDDESYIDDCKETLASLRAKRTESINMTTACLPIESHPSSNEESSHKDQEVNSNFHQNHNEKSCPENNNEKSNTEMDISTFEIAFSPLPANVKTDPDLSPSYEDPLSPFPTSNESPNRRKSPCFTFENTSLDNNLLQKLSQTVKTSDKNVTFIFNNCTFTHCFNNK